MKPKVNQKVLLGSGALLALVAIIAASSFFPFIIDPSQWQTTDFLTRETIIIVITISGMVTSMFIGQARNAEDPRSEIAKSKVRFAESVSKVKGKDPNAFRQWVKEVLEPSDTKAKRERLAAKVGIEDGDLFSLDLAELRGLLVSPAEIRGKCYRTITEEQFRFIKDWKAGKYAIDFEDPSYYLKVSSVKAGATISEKAGSETSTKTKLLSANMGSKILQTLMIGMTFASLVYDAAAAGDQAQQAMAWINFATRICALVTSAFSGYMVGSKVNDIESDYINMRSDVHELFLADRSFKAKTAEEIAKEEVETAKAELEQHQLIEGGTE